MRRRPLTSALDLGHSAALATPAPIVPLRYLSQLRLFVDAGYTSAMTFVPAAQFSAAGSQYLQAGHSASLDFSTGTNANKFSIELWRNTAVIGNNRCYVSKDINGTAGKRGWALRTSGSVNQESQLEFWAYNNSASSYGAVSTTNAPVNWSHCIVTVDLTAPAVNFYFSGMTTPATTTPFTGTYGLLPTGQNAPLLLGAWNFGGSGLLNFYDGALASVRLWRSVLPTSVVPVLFNGGFPVTYAKLLATIRANLAAAWDLTELSGTRSDSTGNANHLSEQNGPLAQAALCASLVERSPAGYAFVAPQFNYAPRWIAQSPINNQPALLFSGQNWMHAVAAGFGSDCLAGDIFTVIRPTDLSIANFDYSIITADKETYDGNFCYMFPLIYNSKLELRIRRDKATAINNDPRGTTTISANNTYVTNQRGFGTGGLASFAYRLNGSTNPIDTSYNFYSSNGGNIQNQWYASLDAVDSLVLGGLNYDLGSPLEGPFGVQDRYRGYLAAALVYGGTTVSGGLADNDNLAVESWARTLANV